MLISRLDTYAGRPQMWEKCNAWWYAR